MIPVDMVAGAILGAAMNALVDDKPPLVFQACSGDSNPNDMKRIVGLVGLYKREHFKEKETGNKLVNSVAAMIEADAGYAENLRTDYPRRCLINWRKRANAFAGKSQTELGRRTAGKYRFGFAEIGRKFRAHDRRKRWTRLRCSSRL